MRNIIKLTVSPTILISRTDSIGDVMLTLPLAGMLKQLFPQSRLLFLGRNYTRDIIACCQHVQEFISYDDLCLLTEKEKIEFLKNLHIDVVLHVFPQRELAQLFKKAGVPHRIGTTNRLYHWLNCTYKVALSRKNSSLHEAQLNLKLLEPLGFSSLLPLKEIPHYYGFTAQFPLAPEHKALLDPHKHRLILHPKSKGSGKEWGLNNFSELIRILPPEHYQVFISGTKEEGLLLKKLIQEHPQVTDLTGKLSLSQFITFISHCHGLIAASTGPLHLAAALGIKALGLFSPRKPMHPGRWQALGIKASYLVYDENCTGCKKTTTCNCIQNISASQVLKKYESIA